MQTIQLKNYEDRTNKNNKLYLVLKDHEDTTFMCQDPRLFDTIRNSIVINAEVATEVNGNATFRKIVEAQTVQAGALPKADPKPRWTGGNGGGGSSSGGGGGAYKADPLKQAFIIRENAITNGINASLALLKDGHLDLQANESVAHGIMRYGLEFAKSIEGFVRKAEPVEQKEAPAPQAAAPAPAMTAPMPTPAPQQAAPAPAPAPAPVPAPQAGSEFDDGLPY